MQFAVAAFVRVCLGVQSARHSRSQCSEGAFNPTCCRGAGMALPFPWKLCWCTSVFLAFFAKLKVTCVILTEVLVMSRQGGHCGLRRPRD